MKKICVLGNYSGRNAGDAALLGGLLEDVSSLYPGARFLIPTIKPSFIRRQFSRYPATPVSLTPWNLSLKILGLPVVTSTLGADLILVTDAILFDLKLLNPLRNYLYTLSRVLPLARRRGVPVVLYNMSIGPVRTERGQACLARVLDCADLIIVRDTVSLELVQRLGGYSEKLHAGADCALNVTPSGEERLRRIIREKELFASGKPTLGFNINACIDAFTTGRAGGIGRGDFLGITAAVIGRAIDSFDADALLVITQAKDLRIAGELLHEVGRPGRLRLVSNRECTHEDLAAILSRLETFTGMRTHSLILATAVGTPTSGIVSHPRNRGYLRSLGMDDQLIEFADFTEENLWRLVERTWRRRAEIKKRLIPAIAREKARARHSAALLKPFLA